MLPAKNVGHLLRHSRAMCLGGTGILLVLLLVLGRYLIQATKSMPDYQPIVSLSARVQTIDRVDGGIVICGTVTVVNNSEEAAYLGEQSVISMITLRLRDVHSNVNYSVNLSSMSSLQGLDIKHIALAGRERQEHDYCILIKGPRGRIGDKYVTVYTMKSRVGESTSEPGVFWVLH
jgi:hypothetical protein